MNYFYHSSIKNYTISLLDLFNDFKVPRYNSNNDRIKDYPIPVEFGNRSKASIISEHNIENIHTGNVNTLPNMTLSFESLSKANIRDTNPISKINTHSSDSLMQKFHYNSVSYDFNFMLTIRTKTFTDATILIEQIAPLFRPNVLLEIQELDIQDEPTIIPVILGDFDVTLPEDLDEEETRIVVVDVDLILKGNLYLPIKEESIISSLKTNLGLNDGKAEMEASIISADKDGSKTKHLGNSGDIFEEIE